MSPDDLAKYSQALLTPAIAIAVAGVGFLNWRTAQNKLKLDLFDRRYEIYRQFMRMFVKVSKEVGKDPPEDDADMNEFDLENSHVVFLFDTDISDEMGTFIALAKHGRAIREQMSQLDPRPGQENVKAFNEMVTLDRANREKLFATARRLMLNFPRYLSFKHLRHGEASQFIGDAAASIKAIGRRIDSQRMIPR